MIRSKIVLLKSTQWLDEESNNNYFEVYFVGFLLEWLKREKERKNNKDLEEDEDLSKKEKEMYRSEAQRIFTFEYALRLIKRTCPPFSHRFSKYVLKAWFNRALFSEREREREREREPLELLWRNRLRNYRPFKLLLLATERCWKDEGERAFG